jgi:hypothetical protein
MKLKHVYTFLIFFAAAMIINPLIGVMLKDDTTFVEQLLYPTGIFLRALIAAYFSWKYADKIFKSN